MVMTIQSLFQGVHSLGTRVATVLLLVLVLGCSEFTLDNRERGNITMGDMRRAAQAMVDVHCLARQLPPSGELSEIASVCGLQNLPVRDQWKEAIRFTRNDDATVSLMSLGSDRKPGPRAELSSFEPRSYKYEYDIILLISISDYHVIQCWTGIMPARQDK